MTDKQINKFSDLTFTQIFGYDLVATFNNNRKIKELQEQLKAKEQEVDVLKAENEELKRQLETKGKILTLIDEAKNEYLKENKKLKQILTEIKEIVHKIDDECGLEGYASCALEYKEQILNKISEVEDE